MKKVLIMVEQALLRAIRIIGSRRQLLKILDVSPERLNAWLNRGVYMGLEYALAIEFLTSGQVTAAELAPAKLHVLRKVGLCFSPKAVKEIINRNCMNGDK